MLRIVPSTSRAISLNPKSVSPLYAGRPVVACIPLHSKGELSEKYATVFPAKTTVDDNHPAGDCSPVHRVPRGVVGGR